MNQDVVLVNQSELFAVALNCNFERIANQALNTVGGVHRNFVGNFVFGANANGSAVANIETLGAFAHHNEVDLARVS